jgi:hypothetical protein
MFVSDWPKWRTSSLGGVLAPLQFGQSEEMNQTNGIDRAERRQVHWLSSLRNYFYACDVSSEKKTADERWGVVPTTWELKMTSEVGRKIILLGHPIS